MKGLKISLATALLALFATQTTQAAPTVYFKAPVNFAGTGCDIGSVAYTGENTSTLSILFGRYDAGKNAISGLQRSACNFAVPIHVPAGLQVSIMTADWQGYAKGSANLRRSYFFANAVSNNVTKSDNFNSGAGTNFLKQDGLWHASATSGCSPQGRDLIMRINSSATANTSNSYIAVDTVDMNNRVVFHLNWAPCH